MPIHFWISPNGKARKLIRSHYVSCSDCAIYDVKLLHISHSWSHGVNELKDPQDSLSSELVKEEDAGKGEPWEGPGRSGEWKPTWEVFQDKTLQMFHEKNQSWERPGNIRARKQLDWRLTGTWAEFWILKLSSHFTKRAIGWWFFFPWPPFWIFDYLLDS